MLGFPGCRSNMASLAHRQSDGMKNRGTKIIWMYKWWFIAGEIIYKWLSMGKSSIYTNIWLVVFRPTPLKKMMEFVKWDSCSQYMKVINSMFQTTNQSSFSIILTTTLPNLVATIQIHTVWLQFENLSSHVILTHTHIRREIKTGGSSFFRRSSVALASLQALSKCSFMNGFPTNPTSHTIMLH